MIQRVPRGAIPYLLLLPGIGWLVLFYLYPALQLFLVSLWTGNITQGYQQTWNFGIYAISFASPRPKTSHALHSNCISPNPP